MINIVDLWKSYEDKQVLKGLNLNIEEGETLVILGRSGVGKSVLLKLMIGLEEPDRGEIEINGTSLSTLRGAKRYEYLRKMGMLFQAGALFDSMTVGENTAFYLDQHRVGEGGRRLSTEEIRRRASLALEMVGLSGTEELMPSALSGGMQKRAALARLIVYRPTIILYDEPTTGLDPITAKQIKSLIIKTKEELKATSIVVTHDPNLAISIGDRLALHHDGEIVFIADVETFIHTKHPVIEAFFHHGAQISEN